MADGAHVYLVNLLIGMLLSAMMGRQRSLPSSGHALPAWIVAAWTLTAADLLFVLRVEWPEVVPRLAPTLTVTVGHVMLLLAAHRTAARPPVMWVVLAVVVVHAAALVGFALVPEAAPWRAVTNSVVWGALSVAAGMVLRRAAPALRAAMQLPALVLFAQGAFHAVRTALAVQAALRAAGEAAPLVQLLGDFEVSLFMVALFVSVLVAFLQLANRELREARDDVQQLSGMLPLCAWCHKVRDDDGYWQRLEEYFAEQRINVTHAMCESCVADHLAQTHAAGASPSAPPVA